MYKKRCFVWDLSSEEIQSKVNKCNSIRDVVEIFGYSRSSGGMANVLSKILKDKHIDTSHFKPYSRFIQTPRYSLEDILIPNSSYTNMYKLKDRILKAELLEYKCEMCGNSGEWNGKKLVLQLDHKDGDHKNHSLSNLRFLCPNCHSQTDTYSGKNAKYNTK